jgi:hypothetical protein
MELSKNIIILGSYKNLALSLMRSSMWMKNGMMSRDTRSTKLKSLNIMAMVTLKAISRFSTKGKYIKSTIQ